MITLSLDKEQLRQVEKHLKQLSEKDAQKVVKQSVRRGAAVIRKAMRGEAPRDKTGKLKKSVKVRRFKYRKRDGSIIARIGSDPRIFPHAHLVEFGHRVVLGGTISSGGSVRPAKDTDNTGKGRVVGFAQPQPFARRTYAKVEGPVIEKARQEIIKKIESAAKKYGAK